MIDKPQFMNNFNQRILNHELKKDIAPNNGQRFSDGVDHKDFMYFDLQFSNSSLMEKIIQEEGPFKSESYESVIEEFGRDTITGRLDILLSFINLFIKSYEKRDLPKQITITVDEHALQNAILSYFTDVSRLKSFHNIVFTNLSKVYGYMGFWILRYHPIIVIKDDAREISDLTPLNLDYLNEKFVVSMILNGILSDLDITPKDVADNTPLLEFKDLLLYTLKYREYSPKSLELMITGFLAGAKSFQKNE